MPNFLRTPKSLETEPLRFSREPKPAVSRIWQWTSVVGNAGLGAIETIYGHISNTLSVFADGVHNGGDALSYYTQTDNERNGHKYSEEKLKRRRKFGYWVIALSSSLAGVKAGADLFSGRESEHSEIALYASVASLSLSGMLLVRLQKGIRSKQQLEGRSTMTTKEKDLMMHVGRYDVPSAAAATIGAIVQKYNVDIEQVIAMASGAYGTYLFRPTAKNLAENHSHSLEDIDRGHECGHGHGHEQERQLTWREKLSSHIWATGSYLGGRIKQWSEKLTSSEGKKRPLLRKAVLGVTAVAGVGLGVTAWKYSQGAFDSIPTNGANTVPSAPPPPQLPDIASPVLPIPEVPEVAYSSEAQMIRPYEGWNQTLSELGVASEHRPELLQRAGNNLIQMTFPDGSPVAYWQGLDIPSGGEWRMYMSPDGAMPESVLDYLSSEAKLLVNG